MLLNDNPLSSVRKSKIDINHASMSVWRCYNCSRHNVLTYKSRTFYVVVVFLLVVLFFQANIGTFESKRFIPHSCWSLADKWKKQDRLQ